MCFPSRKVLAAVLVALVMVTGGFPTVGSTRCMDGCDDGDGTTCADCPLCSPGRAPVVLGQGASPFLARPSSAYETELILRPSRTEDDDVFHVPRRLV